MLTQIVLGLSGFGAFSKTPKNIQNILWRISKEVTIIININSKIFLAAYIYTKLQDHVKPPYLLI